MVYCICRNSIFLKGVNCLTESRKRGRPFAEKPLDIDVKVRLDAETAAALDRYCEKHGMQRAKAIRAAVVGMLAADRAGK